MVPRAAFGRTGHDSSRVIFGAAALGGMRQEKADAVLELLPEFGVNHIDTAAAYGDSELRVGAWMPEHRDRFFLATKTGERHRADAWAELQRSLERLRTDHVDLWQLHNLVDPIEWDAALSPGGALEAAIEAREQGLVRFIGVTGHGISIARMHARSLGRFDFDSVLLPYSFQMMQDEHYAAGFEALASLCAERGVAVQTIKSIARRPWMGRTQTRDTWYEPLEDQADIDAAVQWVLRRPGIFLNTAGDVSLLPAVLDAADRFAEGGAEPDMAVVRQERAMEPLFV